MLSANGQLRATDPEEAATILCGPRRQESVASAQAPPGAAG
jgi:hypothetical protein